MKDIYGVKEMNELSDSLVLSEKNAMIEFLRGIGIPESRIPGIGLEFCVVLPPSYKTREFASFMEKYIILSDVDRGIQILMHSKKTIMDMV